MGVEERKSGRVEEWESEGSSPELPLFHSSTPPFLDAASPLPAGLPWETLRAAYEYERAACLAVTEEVRDDPEYRLARLTFHKAGGESHTGLLLRPRAPGRYPGVLLLHALSRDKEEMIRLFGRPFAERGLASLA